MKIYYIANARMPTEKAHGIQLAKMCEAFLGQGAELELVLPGRRTGIRESPEQFYSLDRPLPWVKLPALDCYSRGKAGFMTGSFSFIFSYFRYIRSKVRRERCVIYTTDLDQFSFLGVPFLGLPYFAEIHDAKNYSLPFSVLFRRAAGIIVINDLIKEKIVSVFGADPQKIIVHPNGIDIPRFTSSVSPKEARFSLGLPTEGKIALYSGRCYPWKGLEILGEAARSAPEIFFHFAGGTAEDFIRTTDRPGSRSSAGTEGAKANTAELSLPGRNFLPSNLIFHGEKPYGEMPLWLAAADVLLVCGTAANEYSYSHTSPMKLFEYMASGRPVVAANTPANRQIVSEKEAFFYRPDSPEALAGAVRLAISRPEEAGHKAEAARRRVSDFAWDKRAKSILAFMASRL